MKVLRLLEIFDRGLEILVRTNWLIVVLNRSMFVSRLEWNMLDEQPNQAMASAAAP